MLWVVPVPIDIKIWNELIFQRAEKLAAAPLRRLSRLTRQSECCICGAPIRPGEQYRDAGLHTRAHERCVRT